MRPIPQPIIIKIGYTAPNTLHHIIPYRIHRPSICISTSFFSISNLMAAVSKSGQIPAFGDWETANELPITQYFECARQAGLLRCSCSGECSAAAPAANADLYGFVFDDHRTLPRRVYAAVSQRKTHPHSKGHIKNQVLESTAQRKSQRSAQKLYSMQKSSITVKPVDEDLYKIPPEFLHNSKRKKMLGFFSRCMAPPCAP